MKSTIDGEMTQIIKEATLGLIGDSVGEINLDDLYNRVKDKCDKYGVYAPSWARFVELVESLYEIDTRYFVKLPKVLLTK